MIGEYTKEGGMIQKPAYNVSREWVARNKGERSKMKKQKSGNKNQKTRNKDQDPRNKWRGYYS